eukprot:13238389-Alexandrium_andersonii.AAC.1
MLQCTHALQQGWGSRVRLESSGRPRERMGSGRQDLRQRLQKSSLLRCMHCCTRGGAAVGGASSGET